jgi:cytochrome bd ubiquinol oxidase subunit I
VDVLDLARWQFGITTVYHFLVVPLTIGLGLLVAGMHTAWYRTRNPRWRRMATFWGRIYLANFALGVATGLVQEFQFGLSWSEYSRFVGDVFGSLLAMEALLAFFVESTFLGLWIFGADRLPRAVHLACIWLAVGASVLSAYFIIAANSWMQHPVGVTVVDGRPVLEDIGAVLTNNTAVAAFSHAIVGSLIVAGTLAVAVGVYHLHRRSPDEQVWRGSLRIGAVVSIVAFAGLLFTGDAQAKLMYEQQPLKMSAAEALCETSAPAPLSVFAIGKLGGECDDVTSWTVPGLLSFLAHGDFSSPVPGVTEVQQEYQQQYGATYPDDAALRDLAGAPIRYQPLLEVTYWGFRLMIAGGAVAALLAAWLLWATRRGRRPRSRWLVYAALAGVAAPLAGNAAGWIFTEMGRQPFVVAPNPDVPLAERIWFFTAQAVTPGLSLAEIITSLVLLTALYGVLAVVEVWVIRRLVRRGTDPPATKPPAGAAGSVPRQGSTSDEDVLTLAY